MGEAELRAELMADEAVWPHWAELERLDRRNDRLRNLVLLPAFVVTIAAIIVMSLLRTYAHQPWLAVSPIAVPLVVGLPVALHEQRARSRAHRRALFESAKRGYVSMIPHLAYQLGSRLGADAPEGRALLIDLLATVRPEHRTALDARGTSWIARLLPSGPASRPPAADEPLVLAALSALKHVGGARDLPRIRLLAEEEEYAGAGTPVRRAAAEAIAAIEERLAHEADAATLLRPAEPGAEVLLRAAEDGEANLLRASEDQGREART